MWKIMLLICLTGALADNIGNERLLLRQLAESRAEAAMLRAQVHKLHAVVEGLHAKAESYLEDDEMESLDVLPISGLAPVPRDDSDELLELGKRCPADGMAAIAENLGVKPKKLQKMCKDMSDKARLELCPAYHPAIKRALDPKDKTCSPSGLVCNFEKPYPETQLRKNPSHPAWSCKPTWIDAQQDCAVGNQTISSNSICRLPGTKDGKCPGHCEDDCSMDLELLDASCRVPASQIRYIQSTIQFVGTKKEPKWKMWASPYTWQAPERPRCIDAVNQACRKSKSDAQSCQKCMMARKSEFEALCNDIEDYAENFCSAGGLNLQAVDLGEGEKPDQELSLGLNEGNMVRGIVRCPCHASNGKAITMGNARGFIMAQIAKIGIPQSAVRGLVQGDTFESKDFLMKAAYSATLMLQCWAKKCSADTLLNSELDDLLAENTDDGAGWDCG